MSEEGEFISNVQFHHRNKRDVKRVQQTLYINVTAFNKDFNMKLELNTHLLAPGFSVYHRHGQNASHQIATDSESNTDCLYKGEVTSSPGSVAAITLCHGIVSIAYLSIHTYWWRHFLSV